MLRLALLLFVFILVACSRFNEDSSLIAHLPKVVEAKGYVVPKDSMAEPQVVLVDESKLTKVPVGKPKVVPTNINVHPAGVGKVIVLDETKLRKIVPGTDTFALPKTVPAIDSPFVAGISEVVVAKDPYIRDQNPQNFSSFSKLQGLKHDAISCMMQDQKGNLWFGTLGGGVSKYDGKSFTHFTEKEGLSNNTVYSILQDQSGNMWFGTDGGGVSKYDGNSFTHFTEKEGLSNNIVFSILEDQSGSLWFATLGGGVSKLALSKVEGHDHYSFTHFTEKEGLSNNIVLSILEDRIGNLWFGTLGGGVSKLALSKVEGYDHYSFTHFTEKEGLSNNRVKSILQDQIGNLWFGTLGGGVTKYDGNRVEEMARLIKEGKPIPPRAQQDLLKENGKLVKSFTHFTEKEGLLNNTVLSILQDQSGNLWFGTNGGLSKYDGNFVSIADDNKEQKFHKQNTEQNISKKSKEASKSFTHFTEKEGLSNNTVFSILQDQSGNMWFGTDGGGVSKYDGNLFTHFTEKEGLPNNQVFSILEDQSGNLWFGTYGGGVTKYDGNSFTHFTEKEGLSNNRVYSILQDQSGNMWFGTDGGVSKYDGNSFIHFTKKEGLSNNIVLSILQDQIGNLWFGTEGGGVTKYDGNRVEEIERLIKEGRPIPPRAQQDLKKENGKLVKSFTHFTEKEGLSNNSVRSILQDQSGNLWFGTLGGGVSKLALSKVEGYDHYSFTHFTEKEGLSNNQVLSILEDQSGSLWFATLGGGISKLALSKVKGYANYSFTYFTEREGLSNNYVFNMLQDKAGNLWFGTRFGLNKLSKKKLVDFFDKYKSGKLSEKDLLFKSYGYEDGFLGTGVNLGKTIYEARDGTIWIGANDRLTAYHPTKADVPNTLAPNIQLTSISLFNENIAWVNLAHKKDTGIVLGNGVRIGDFGFDGISKWYGLPENLSLAYNNNYLTFNFIGITMRYPKKVKYQYKLEGIDENWSAITNRAEAPYGNLPNGTYTFKVKAMNSDGYWSKPIEYTFTIRPPWWRTWWAYTLYAVSALFSVVLYIRWRERALRKRQKELEVKVDEATTVIRSQKQEVERQRDEIELQKAEVEIQKQHSEDLLLNILPVGVAEELKSKGSAEAKLIEEVTVLFTDFKGFTQLSEKLTPKDLVKEIHECFSAFDVIMQKHGIEKIKTIGDAYMAAGGLPLPSGTHARDVVLAALDIQYFMENHKIEKEAKGELYFTIRIGIHTGPVVAGIVGIKKFAYDIWGDTVNMASRMESSGEVGKVNISGATYELVKPYFNCEYRGEIEAKGKGKLDMYFVTGKNLL
jgi:ligand-binding sensor domain-containing protein/class 3 adenylate cyclase